MDSPNIPDSPRIIAGGAEVRLFYHRHDGPGDEIPIIREMEGNDRLNIQHVLQAMVGLQPEIHVVL